MSVIDKDLAMGEVVGTVTYTPLFAGDAPVVTEEAILDTGNLAKYTVVGKITATGKIVQLTQGASDGSQIAYGIMTQAANASSADQKVGIYVGGFFNDAALVWPDHADYSSLIERQALFARTPIRIGSVRL